MYAPQNVFCYVIDAHSPRNFTLSMNALADCFPNVFVLSEQFNVDSSGHNMTRAHLACMAHLLKAPFDWRYLITLHVFELQTPAMSGCSFQNDDVPLKTNRELVHILTALNGSNDIEVVVPNADRIPQGFDWHYSALRLLRNNRTMKIGTSDRLIQLDTFCRL